MQLNRTTDYVVRIVYFLSNENRIFTSEEISRGNRVLKRLRYINFKKIIERRTSGGDQRSKGRFSVKEKTGRNQFV